jgi:hypothetical protein
MQQESYPGMRHQAMMAAVETADLPIWAKLLAFSNACDLMRYALASDSYRCARDCSIKSRGRTLHKYA